MLEMRQCEQCRGPARGADLTGRPTAEPTEQMCSHDAHGRVLDEPAAESSLREWPPAHNSRGPVTLPPVAAFFDNGSAGAGLTRCARVAPRTVIVEYVSSRLVEAGA